MTMNLQNKKFATLALLFYKASFCELYVQLFLSCPSGKTFELFHLLLRTQYYVLQLHKLVTTTKRFV